MDPIKAHNPAAAIDVPSAWWDVHPLSRPTILAGPAVIFDSLAQEMPCPMPSTSMSSSSPPQP